MKNILRVFFLSGILAGIYGCSILSNSQEPKTYFVLEAPPDSSPQFETPLPKTLLLGASNGGIFIASPRILFSDTPGTRSYYQYSFWTEPPTLQFIKLLLGKFDYSKGFRVVSRSSNGVVGDYQLNTEIQEFYQDRTVSPPVARVVVAADLLSVIDRKIIASRSFSEAVPLTADTAAGAAGALSKATDKLLDDLIKWTVESVPPGE